MPKRKLKYASAVFGVLERANARHIFAQRHALNIYASSSIYSLIPKNACSTMRLSLAIDNGVVNDLSQAEWIIVNTFAFSAALADLLRARYTFILLRCPYARLASCFIDKFTRRTVPAKKYQTHLPSVDLETLTFKQFCASLNDPRIGNLDAHWRPQVDFLVYEEYDDVFCVERLSTAAQIILEKANLEVVDSRNLIKHGSDQFELLPKTERFSNIPISEINAYRKNRRAPHPVSLYDDETMHIVKKLYHADFELFGRHYPGISLFSENSQKA